MARLDLKARVLQVALSLNPGGTERLVVELARRLHPKVPTMVCCLDEPGNWAAELEPAGIEIRSLGRRKGFRPLLGRALGAVAVEHGATVIHAHHYSPFVYACISQLTGRIPIVFTEHGRLSDTPPSVKRQLVNRFLRGIPWRTCAVSSDLADHMAAEGFRRARVDVVYNGIEPGPAGNIAARHERRALLGISPEHFLVGTVARLDAVKDLGTLLRAASLVPAGPAVQIVIIGDGPERTALERECDKLGLTNRVRFLGRRDDAREWLWAFDAYVNCSVSEGVSLTILEAMAASLPILATRVGGTPEVVDETCARLVPSRNPGAVAEAITAFLHDPEGSQSLGRRARQRLEERFTIDRMVEEYSSTYRRATADRGQRSAG